MEITSKYRPPYWLFNGHLQTIYPALFRKVELEGCERERIDTPDGDFLDLDWYRNGQKKLAILCHGLEGSSDRAYMKGAARALIAKGIDVLCWNYRGCSGEMNRRPRFYHSGATDDLDTVVGHALSKNKYNGLFLMGFSLGGNLVLKYLGERGDALRPEISRGMALSVPLDLAGSSREIARPKNYLYEQRFLKSLKRKVSLKAALGLIDVDPNQLKKVVSVWEFDDQFTAPLHGFANAEDYYEKCSSLGFLDKISVPTLILNARNDSFLADTCYPHDKLKDHPFVSLITPARGGHVGFASENSSGTYWHEKLATVFFTASNPQVDLRKCKKMT